MNEFSEKNPNYKTGVKILTDAQMQMGFPLYDTLLEKIERVRTEAEKVNYSALLKQSFENLKYDQIFSILGGRGAGKTSVLMTLRHNLEQEEHNIIFPIIMPELIEDDESIVSWIISAMRENLRQVESKILESKTNFDGYQQLCTRNKPFERCEFNQQSNLYELLDDLSDAYYTTKYMAHNSGMDYATHKELMAAGVESSYSLTNKFTIYWNKLVDIYIEYLEKYYKINGIMDKTKTPLIFIFIDDADLKPHILNELLFIIPKYLSHPNVVVFVSASQKTLAYSVKNFMYHSITQTSFDLPALMDIEYQYNGKSVLDGEGKTIKFHDLRYGREYDKIKKLSDEILRKIFPMYNRFYLKKYDRYQDKGLLQMFKTEDSECRESVSLSKKISVTLSQFYTNISEMHNGISEDIMKEKSKGNGFKLLKNPGNSAEVTFANEMYLSFFGRYSRDIVSVYYVLEDTLNAMEELLKKYYKSGSHSDEMSEEYTEPMYEIITKFITAAVDSNPNLTMFSRAVRDIVKTKLLHWQLYVDYNKVLEIFQEERYYEENKKNIAPFVEIICLLNFVEQLIVLIMPERKTTHGYEEFPKLLELGQIKIINYQTYKREKNIYKMLEQYYTFYLLDLIPEFNIQRYEHRKNFIRGVIAIGLIPDLSKIPELRKDVLRNPRWSNLLITSFISTYSIISVIPKYRYELFILTQNFQFIDEIYSSLQNDYIVYLENVFLNNDKFDEKLHDGKIIDDMEDNIEKLNTAIDELYLEYHGNLSEGEPLSIFESVERIEFIDITLAHNIKTMLKRFENHKHVRRNEFLMELSRLETAIKNENEQWENSRWESFMAELKKCVTVVKDGSEYEAYKKACEEIRSHYKHYINYYAGVINDEFRDNKEKDFDTMVELCAKLKSSFPQKYDTLQFREWHRILEME